MAKYPVLVFTQEQTEGMQNFFGWVDRVCGVLPGVSD